MQYTDLKKRIPLLLLIPLLMFQIPARASKDLSGSYIELYVNPNLVQYGNSINITGRLYPPISASVGPQYTNQESVDEHGGRSTIKISIDQMDRETWVNVTDGYFQMTWIPPMRGTYTITASWKGDEDHFAAMNQVYFEVIGGPGPSWIKRGAYLHYVHDIEGEITWSSSPVDLDLIYSFHPVEPRSHSTIWPEPIAYWPSSPSDMILIRAQEQFPRLSWNGQWCIINMTNRDAYGSLDGTWTQDRGKTWLWIDPNVSIGDKVQLWQDSYTVSRSENIRYKDEFREAWVLENPYRTLWYDKEIGILLKATNILNEAPYGWSEKVGYPYSVYLYDTNIPFSSSLSLEIDVSKTYVGSTVELSGHLNPRLDTLIQVEWSQDQATWNSISFSTLEGSYSNSWSPPCSGEIYLKTSWEGNEYYTGSESEVKKITVFASEYEMRMYDELQETYYSLKDEHDALESSHTELLKSHQALQDEYEALVLDHELLSGELEASKNELSLKTNILYAVSATSILFLVTTIYFARRLKTA